MSTEKTNKNTPAENTNSDAQTPKAKKQWQVKLTPYVGAGKVAVSSPDGSFEDLVMTATQEDETGWYDISKELYAYLKESNIELRENRNKRPVDKYQFRSI